MSQSELKGVIKKEETEQVLYEEVDWLTETEAQALRELERPQIPPWRLASPQPRPAASSNW